MNNEYLFFFNERRYDDIKKETTRVSFLALALAVGFGY